MAKQWDHLNAKYADLASPEWLDRVPAKFWEDFENHRRFVKWFEIQNGIQTLDDWYRFSPNDVRRAPGGVSILEYYMPSLIGLLKAVYPTRRLERVVV